MELHQARPRLASKLAWIGPVSAMNVILLT
jgi:hypothetical protein